MLFLDCIRISPSSLSFYKYADVAPLEVNIIFTHAPLNPFNNTYCASGTGGVWPHVLVDSGKMVCLSANFTNEYEAQCQWNVASCLGRW